MNSITPKKTVSIIIPCYNGEKFLSRAIVSAKNQSYVPREIIVVDDGSTDNSARIAESGGVILIEQCNQGVSTARNTGLNSTNSDFIIFLDADDELDPQAVENHLRAIGEDDSIAIHFGSNLIIDEFGEILGENRVPSSYYNRKSASNRVSPGPSQCMYRTKNLKSAGGFQQGLHHSEDVELLLRLLETAQAKSTDSIVVNYRQHSNQATKKPSSGLKGALEVLKIAENRKPEDIDWKSIRNDTKLYYGQFIPSEILRSLLTNDIKSALNGVHCYTMHLPHTLIGTIKFIKNKLKIRSSDAEV